MLDAPSPQGWYPSPENSLLVRFWDGEIWTDRTRPAPSASSGAEALAGPDHFVQHSPVVAAELRDGETIRLSYRSLNANTGRGPRDIRLSTHGGGADDMVGWIRLQMGSPASGGYSTPEICTPEITADEFSSGQ